MVGGRVVLPDGTLQEAGCAILGDGWTRQIGRGRTVDDPVAQFERPVDYCSGAFLMVRRNLFESVGGLDEVYSPGYFEDPDLAIRLRQRGFCAAFLPDITVLHYENATSERLYDPAELVKRNHKLFRERHRGWLAGQADPARWCDYRHRRADDTAVNVLVFPVEGDVRGVDRLSRTLERLDAMLTVVTPPDEAVALQLRNALPPTCEIVSLPTPGDLDQFLSDRAGYFDLALAHATLTRDQSTVLSRHRQPIATPKADEYQFSTTLPGRPRVDSRVFLPQSFRVAYVVCLSGPEAATVRYRAFNVIEAIRPAGYVADHFDARHILDQLDTIIGYDLIVLVRRPYSPEIDRLIDAADRAGVPVIADMDDGLFDEATIPHIGLFQTMPAEFGAGVIDSYRRVIRRARYFTGATRHLVERAELAGRPGYLIRNGYNTAQKVLSDRARETHTRPDDGRVSLGYSSGTRTNQADFRTIASTLAKLMGEFSHVHLIVVGDFDLDEFVEFAGYADRVHHRTLVPWTNLPAEIARADINLVPLEQNVFTDCKSNFNYYEPALLGIPTVASPTRAYADAITTGDNGFLATSSDEWYESLRSMIASPELRARIGGRAYQRAVSEYGPEAVAREALAAYREILRTHRTRHGEGGGVYTSRVA